MAEALRPPDGTPAGPSRARALAYDIAALASPLFVLALAWGVLRLVSAKAPGVFVVAAVGAVASWLGSIYLVARTLHRLLWRNRVTDAGPWGKALLTALGTVLWFGVIAQLLSLLFPRYFRR